MQFLVIGSLLLLLAVVSYPLQPQRLLTALAITVVGVAAGLILAFYVQMDKNQLISRISKTPVNRLTLDATFFGNLAPYVLPLVVVLIAQIPGVSDMLYSWLQPFIRY